MRFRRRGRGSFRAKGVPQRKGWDRLETSTFNANAFGVPTQLAIFDPTTNVPGTQEEELTVHRMILEVFPTFTFTAAVVQFLVMGLGVYIGGADEGVKDPLLTAATDERTDWLYLARDLVLIGAGASVLSLDSAARGIRGASWSFNCPTIRSKRKVTQDQRIFVSANLKRLDSATFAAPTQSRAGIVADVSTLYSLSRK